MYCMQLLIQKGDQEISWKSIEHLFLTETATSMAGTCMCHKNKGSRMVNIIHMGEGLSCRSSECVCTCRIITITLTMLLIHLYSIFIGHSK